MKLHPLIAAVSGVLLFSGHHAIAQEQTKDAPAPPPAKVATVDVQKLFKAYHRTKELQQEIDAERARVQKDMSERHARISKLQTNLGNLKKQIEDPSINDSEKLALHKEWQKQQEESNALDRERREFLQTSNNAINQKLVPRINGIYGEIRKLVEEYGKKHKYRSIHDTSGLSSSQVPSLLYAEDAIDITADLLKELNKDAPK